MTGFGHISTGSWKLKRVLEIIYSNTSAGGPGSSDSCGQGLVKLILFIGDGTNTQSRPSPSHLVLLSKHVAARHFEQKRCN